MHIEKTYAPAKHGASSPASPGVSLIDKAYQDPMWVRLVLILAAVAVISVLVIVPIVHVFSEALSEGLATYWKNLFEDPDTLSSIRLTLTVAPIALTLNVLFGLAAAWAIAHFDFPGRTLLVSLIDLPFSVSPVVAGLIFVLIFGLQGFFGPFLRRDGYSIMPYVIGLLVIGILGALYLLFRPISKSRRRGIWKSSWLASLTAIPLFFLMVWLQQYLEIWPREESLKIIFALPGLIIATSFVTFPFVARELIPLMETIGSDEELAALSLGANGWRMFWHVTLPNIKWGLLYGVILCNARAMGEFGAVYVVSGHVAGQTDTMPLRIEKLFQEYNLPGSFAVASLLTMLAIFTLLIKVKLESKLPSAAKRVEEAGEV